MSTWKTLKVDASGPIVTVTLARPDVRNAINRELATELIACLDALGASPDLRVVVLTGEGSVFSAGADLKERQTMAPADVSAFRATVLRAFDTIETFPVPVIARLNGPAIAGGFELALACDLRIAAERAFFALTEGQRVGSFPGGGGPYRLPRLVGKGRAKYIVFTGRRFSAREGFDLGFLEVVVPDARLDEETAALAGQIAANSPLGIRAAKVLLNQSTEMHIQAAALLSQVLRDPQDAGRDHREGLQAWREGRAPRFTGE